MELSPIAVITGTILFVLGTAFAIFLGVSSERVEAARPH
jgi:vacuolar-type H+-ATPase subunit I/STV1